MTVGEFRDMLNMMMINHPAITNDDPITIVNDKGEHFDVANLHWTLDNEGDQVVSIEPIF